MKDCFVLRFNLENMVIPNINDRIGALSAIFEFERTELEESADYYNNCLTALAGSINTDLVEKARKTLSDKKIAFFGDSLTSDRISYANIIKKLNIFKKVDIYAVSGSVSSQLLRTFSQNVKMDDYDIITLFVGTNDSALTDIDFPFISANEFKRNLFYVGDFIQARNAQGICFKLPIHPERTFSDGKIITQDYNDAIEMVGKMQRIKIFDINEVELRFMDDTVHFLGETQKDIAEAFIRMLIKVQL